MKRLALSTGVLTLVLFGTVVIGAPGTKAAPTARVEVSTSEAAGRTATFEIAKRIETLPEAERAKVHKAIKASEAKLSVAEQKELDIKFEAAFKAGPVDVEARNRYYHSAADAMARVRSVTVGQEGLSFNPAEGKLADVFRTLKFTESDLQSQVPKERQDVIVSLAKYGDADVATGILRLADRQDLLTGTTGNGTSNLREVRNMVDQVMSARDGRVYHITDPNDPSRVIRTVEGFNDATNSISKARAVESTGTIQNLMKVIPATPMTAAEFRAVMRQIGESTAEMSDPAKADQALAQLRGLTASYENYGLTLKENLAFHKNNPGKALPTETVKVLDAEGKPVTLKMDGLEIEVKDGLGETQRKVMNDLLKEVNLDRPIAEIMAEVEGKLRTLKEAGKLSEIDMADILHLLRERAVKSVVEKIFRLEVLGKIEKGSTEKFFCQRNADGSYCMNLEPRDASGLLGQNSFLKRAFALCKGAGGTVSPSSVAGGRPSGSGSGTKVHNGLGGGKD